MEQQILDGGRTPSWKSFSAINQRHLTYQAKFEKQKQNDMQTHVMSPK